MQTWTIAAFLISAAINVLVLVFAAFLKAYGTKKGENLATKEDLQNVLEQVKAVTRTTEEIKTDLSEKAWSKQRHWDMKRDAALDVVKIFGEMEQILNNVFHIRNPETITRSKQTVELANDHIQDNKNALDQYLAAIRKFWQAKETVALVFSIEVSKHMNAVQNALAQLA